MQGAELKEKGGILGGKGGRLAKTTAKIKSVWNYSFQAAYPLLSSGVQFHPTARRKCRTLLT